MTGRTGLPSVPIPIPPYPYGGPPADTPFTPGIGGPLIETIYLQGSNSQEVTLFGTVDNTESAQQ